MKKKIKIKKHLKPRKPVIPLPDEDDEDEGEEVYSEIRVGDLSIKSTSDLKFCRENINILLKNKQVKNYLGFYKNKKLYSPPSYID